MFDPILQKEYVHNWPIAFEKGARDSGLRHLQYDMSEAEVGVLCNEAKQKRIAYFKDRYKASYVLCYFRYDDFFLLIKGEGNFTMEDVYVHKWQVVYESSLSSTVVSYLKDYLEEAEAEVFFKAAQEDGQAHFEDDDDRNYTLVYDTSNREYILMRRYGS